MRNEKVLDVCCTVSIVMVIRYGRGQGAGEACGTDGGRLEHFRRETKERGKVIDLRTDGQRLLVDVTYKFLRSFI